MDDKDKPICSFPGCFRPSRGKKSHCYSHIRQIRQAGGDTSVLKPLAFRRMIKTGELCRFPECGRPARAHYKGKGPYCRSHQSQLQKRNGDEKRMTPLPPAQKKPPCKFPGCNEPQVGNGPYCEGHYGQYSHRKDAALLKPLGYVRKKETCSFPGCDRIQHGRKPYCEGHLAQFHKRQRDPSALTPLVDRKARADKNYRVYLKCLQRFYPSLFEEEIRRKWDVIGIQRVGKISKCSSSKRRRLWVKKNGVWSAYLLSRHLMELKEERSLESLEHVDHVDEDPFNDHIDNLQILSNGENSRKNREYLQKIKNWDVYACENICVISGKPFTKRTRHYRSGWRRGDETHATCNRFFGRIFTNLLRTPGFRETFFIRHFRNNIVGRFMTKSATNEDKRKLRTRELIISKVLKDRQAQVKADFNTLVETHQPHMKTSRDMSPREIRFLQERWKEWGREDWSPFYRTFLTEMSKMTEDERLEFLFRTVLPFDLAHGSEMAWRLFNLL